MNQKQNVFNLPKTYKSERFRTAKITEIEDFCAPIRVNCHNEMTSFDPGGMMHRAGDSDR